MVMLADDGTVTAPVDEKKVTVKTIVDPRVALIGIYDQYHAMIDRSNHQMTRMETDAG